MFNLKTIQTEDHIERELVQVVFEHLIWSINKFQIYKNPYKANLHLAILREVLDKAEMLERVEYDNFRRHVWSYFYYKHEIDCGPNAAYEPKYFVYCDRNKKMFKTWNQMIVYLAENCHKWTRNKKSA